MTATTTDEPPVPPHKSPLLWSLLIQVLCSFFLCYLAHHMLRRVKQQYVRRVEEMDRQLKKMDLRLRMQQPSISLVAAIAHKMSMPLDDRSGEKTRVTMLVEGTAPPISSPATALLPKTMMAAGHPPLPSSGEKKERRLVEPEEGTQLSSTRKVKRSTNSKRLLKKL